MNENLKLNDVFWGYIEVEEKNGYTLFYRFSKKQRLFYEEQGSPFGSKSCFQSGVCAHIDDCEKIAFDFKAFDNSEKEICFELIAENGENILMPFNETEGHLEYNCQKERVVLYLPYHAEIGIKNIEIIGEPVEKPEKKIFCFGDSITQGYHAKHQANTYPYVLGKKLGCEVFNFGIGGYYFNSGILGDLNSLKKPYAITVAYGTNDWTSGKEYVPEMEKTFALICKKYSDVPVFVILPIARRNEKETLKTGTLESVRKNIIKAAQQYKNFHIIEGGRSLNVQNMLVDDGVHPNDTGAGFLSECICQEIADKLVSIII